MWEKEKLLITSNFSFSHSVFKRFFSQGHQKVSLCREWVNRLKVRFRKMDRIKGSMANRERAPILVTKSATKKQMKKCIAEIQGYNRFGTKNAGTKGQYYNQREFSLMQWLGIVVALHER